MLAQKNIINTDLALAYSIDTVYNGIDLVEILSKVDRSTDKVETLVFSLHNDHGFPQLLVGKLVYDKINLKFLNFQLFRQLVQDFLLHCLLELLLFVKSDQ